MRASTGSAVTDMATPRNSANARNETGCPSTAPWRSCSVDASSSASPNGSTTEASEIADAVLRRSRIRVRSTSRPTMNMNSTSPSCAITVR
jgi:hypothetical protein